MKRTTYKWMLVVAGLTCACTAFAGTAPTSYPNRPIRMVVPVGAGGGTDIIARIIVAKLAPTLQQQIVVDNRGGAGGIIGTDTVAKAAPDGYTLLFAYASHTITPFLSGKVPYDPAADFSAVGQVSTQPLVLAASLSLAASNVKELIALAKAKPQQIRVGAPGMGGTGHIAAELFKLVTQTDIPTVIYKGGGPAQLALLQGEIHFAFATASAAMPQIKSGKVKVLATSAPKRLTYLPEVPTFIEAGLPQIDVNPWQGILAPAKMPRAIIDKLNSGIAVALKEKDTIERLSAAGADPVIDTPEALAEKIRKELDYFGRVIKAANIRIE
ncbi:MAG: tripartite tricarboxylate transporter substrate binding protein [Pseudomonadota bacterium]